MKKEKTNLKQQLEREQELVKHTRGNVQELQTQCAGLITERDVLQNEKQKLEDELQEANQMKEELREGL